MAYKKFAMSIIGGFAISLSAYCYSSLNGSLIGALIFSFGLLTVVLYQLPLYTGNAGFFLTKKELNFLFFALLGNVIGCLLGALIFSYTLDDKPLNFINKAIEARSVYDFQDGMSVLMKSIGCGFIMTVAVKFARECRQNYNLMYVLPLLFGVPLFLLSGFFHSIVDAFYLSYKIINPYICFSNDTELIVALVGWFCVVLGNLIGCNLSRIITVDKYF